MAYTSQEKIQIICQSDVLESIPVAALPDVFNEDYYFVSYSHRDYKDVYADILHLEEQGLNVWYDRGLPAGRNWQDAAQENVSKYHCNGAIFYLSPNSVRSDAVFVEMAIVKEYHKQFVTVMLPLDGEVLSPLQLLARVRPDLPKDDPKYALFAEMFGEDVLYLPFSAAAEKKVEKIRLMRRPNLFNYATDWVADAYTVAGVNDTSLRLAEIPECDEERDVRIDAIGKCAFCNCTELRKVTLSPYVDKIFRHAFLGCTHLSQINLTNVCDIWDEAFAYCESLTELDLPNCESIAGRAFAGCKSLKKVVLNACVGDAVFDQCTSLSEVTFTRDYFGVDKFSRYMFRGTALRNLTVPGGVEEIDCEALACPLENIEFLPNKKLQIVRTHAFCGCKFQTVDLSPCTALKEIEPRAFYNCDNMSQLVLPVSVKALGVLKCRENGYAAGLRRIYYGGTMQQFCKIEQFDIVDGKRISLPFDSRIEHFCRVLCADGVLYVCD